MLDLTYSAILPEIIMMGGAILVLLVDALRRTADQETRNPDGLGWLSLVIVGASLVATFTVRDGGTGLWFQTSALSDSLSFGIRLIVLATAALVLLIGTRYVSSFTHQSGAYYTLILLSAGAMMAMGVAADLLVLFIALETFSLSLIILAGMFRENPHSTEASMKYFLLGAFASTFFVYGSALIFGATGTVSLSQMAEPIARAMADPQGQVLLWAGLALLLVGFGFKLSLVPFHMWTPDVYQGAPTTVTAFMSVGTKTAMFGALIRFFLLALPTNWEGTAGLLILLAILTMTVGNLTAISQTSLKRILGYSSIAHAGYVLAGLVPGTTTSINAALFYLFAYAFMNVGAFVIIVAIEQASETDIERSQLRGIGSQWPVLSGFMALFLFSLSGIPPLAGFFGKFLLFNALVEGGFAWLAVVVVLNSAVSAYYYLRVVVTMFFRKTEQEVAAPQRTLGLQIGMVTAGLMVVAMGFFPGFWVQLLTVAGS